MECRNKTKFSVKGLAEKRLSELKKDGRAKDKVIYNCSKCLKWHIGRNNIYIK